MRSTLITWAALTCTSVLPCIAAAQTPDDRVGNIKRIAQILGAGRSRTVKQPRSEVRIWEGPAVGWRNAAPKSVIHRADSMMVGRYFDVQLEIKQATQDGKITLSPEFFQKSGQRGFSPVTVGAELANARYGLSTDPSRPGDVAIGIVAGSLIADWKRGRLTVFAAGTRCLITGTEATFRVSSDRQEAFVFTTSGTVTFPDYGDLTVQEQQLWRLRPGQPPQIVSVALGAAPGIGLAMRYNQSRVFGKSFFLTPKGIAVIVAGAALGGFAASQFINGNGPGPTTGGIRIRFPNP